MSWFKTERKWLTGLLVLGLLLGSTSVAWAAPPSADGLVGPCCPALKGKVTAIEDTSLTVDTRRGEVTVLTDDTTRFRIPNVEDPSLEDLNVGATVLVLGLWNEDGSILARIVGRLPERRPWGRLIGQIAAIEDTSLTLELRSGDQIDVLTDENTRFLVPGVTDATIDDLNVGDTVAAQGPRPKDGQIPYAAAVAVLRDPEGRPAGVMGRISEIAGTTLTLELRSGEEAQLVTDENTQFFVRGVEEASIHDLKVGNIIGAQVVEREDGSLYASAIKVGNPRPKPRRGAVLGRISGIEGDTIILDTRRGEVMVQTDEHTRFHIAGIRQPGPPDLDTGQIVGAAGHWEADGSLHARIVVACPPRPAAPGGEPRLP